MGFSSKLMAMQAVSINIKGLSYQIIKLINFTDKRHLITSNACNNTRKCDVVKTK